MEFLLAKTDTAIEKGFAGPGLLAFIVTSKFADYLPLYRLEDICDAIAFEGLDAPSQPLNVLNRQTAICDALKFAVIVKTLS